MSTLGKTRDVRTSFETANETQFMLSSAPSSYLLDQLSPVATKSFGVARPKSFQNHRLSQLPLLHEQRHPGKEGVRISRSTMLFEPEIETMNGKAECTGRGPTSNTGSGAESDHANKGEYLQGWSLALVIIGICMAVFLVSIDRTIITTVSRLLISPTL